MFFLAVARIDNEQRDQSVVLPQASIARSLTKDYNKIVIVNLYPSPPATEEEKKTGRHSEVKYSVFEGYGVREYGSITEVKTNLKSKFDADEKAAKPADWKEGKGRSLIVLRGHKDCKFEQVFSVLKGSKSKELGYRWIDYILRPDVQEKWVREFFISPLNAKAKIPDDLKALIPIHGERLKEVTVFDWADANKNRDTVIERWNKEMA